MQLSTYDASHAEIIVSDVREDVQNSDTVVWCIDARSMQTNEKIIRSAVSSPIGKCVKIGDVDSDGAPDYLVGCPRAGAGACGEALVLTSGAHEVKRRMTGEAPGDGFGGRLTPFASRGGTELELALGVSRDCVVGTMNSNYAVYVNGMTGEPVHRLQGAAERGGYGWSAAVVRGRARDSSVVSISTPFVRPKVDLFELPSMRLIRSFEGLPWSQFGLSLIGFGNGQILASSPGLIPRGVHIVDALAGTRELVVQQRDCDPLIAGDDFGFVVAVISSQDSQGLGYGVLVADPSIGVLYCASIASKTLNYKVDGFGPGFGASMVVLPDLDGDRVGEFAVAMYVASAVAITRWSGRTGVFIDKTLLTQ